MLVVRAVLWNRPDSYAEEPGSRRRKSTRPDTPLSSHNRTQNTSRATKPPHGPPSQTVRMHACPPPCTPLTHRAPAEPPAGQLRLASAATTNFTAQLVAAVAARFPSTLFSTGGDELNVNCYTQDNATQADLAASGRTLEQALNVFTQATHGALRAAGKTPVVWEGAWRVSGV